MIKKMIIVAICLTIAAGAFAQEKTFSWGVKAGVNLANVIGKDAKDLKMKVGFNVGAVTEFKLCEKFAVGPELVYSTQGCSMDMATGNGGTSKVKINAQYLNLPIMAKYYVLNNLSINLGPQLGYAVSIKQKVGSVSVDAGDAYKKFDVSLGVGATYNFGKIFADARYNYGLTKVVKDGSAKNSVIQIGAGYKF